MQTVDAYQLAEEAEMVCVGCQSILKLKIVAEVIDLPDNGFPESVTAIPEDPFQADQNTGQEAAFERLPEDSRKAASESLRAPLPKLEAEPSEGPSIEGEEDRRKKVLICIDGEASREMVQELLTEACYRVIDVPSGIAAFLSMKLEHPDVALIDAGLTDMPGADLCAQIKAHDDLKKTVVILVGSMFEKNARYRRQAPPLCGADDYLDRYHLQSELLPMVQKFLSSKKKAFLPEPKPDLTEEPLQEALDEAGPSPEDLEKAERLARTIFSDIALYNPEKVEEGLRDACLKQALDAEILEGRKLFETRVSNAVMASGCFEKVLEAFLQREASKWQAKNNAPLEVSSPEDLPDPPDRAPFSKNQVPEIPPHEPSPDPEEVERVKRLARIIVSDIAIYNEKKVAEGIRNGRFYQLLSEEIQEGRKLFESRVPDGLPRRMDYFREALADFVKRRHGSEHSEPMAFANAAQAPQEADPMLSSSPEKEPEKLSQPNDPFAEQSASLQEESLSQADPFMAEEDPKAHENAKRLARIILSDIVIYNERKVDLGIRSGRFFDVLKEEIAEGQRLYEARVPETISREHNYFQEACKTFISKRKATAA